MSERRPQLLPITIFQVASYGLCKARFSKLMVTLCNAPLSKKPSRCRRICSNGVQRKIYACGMVGLGRNSSRKLLTKDGELCNNMTLVITLLIATNKETRIAFIEDSRGRMLGAEEGCVYQV